jgi:acetyl-CoA C-acetyltransferase
MREAVIVSAARTPIGKFGGAFKDLSAADLGAVAIKEALKRAGITGDQVDEVIFGTVVAAGQGQISGRQAAVKAGIPHEVPAVTVNKVCASSFKAVTMAAQAIKAGDADIIVAGGMESMTNIPYLNTDQRWGARMGHSGHQDAMLVDGLWCPEGDVHMAVVGSNGAAEHGISREMQDDWAAKSQQKYAAAEAAGNYQDELTSVTVPNRKGDIIVEKDEQPRPDTTVETLAKLKPLFINDGTVTAGNAPSVNDGAAALVIMSREKAEELGSPILGVIKDYAQASSASKDLAVVPGLAAQKLLDKNGLTVDDVDRMEINEAFAAVTLTSALSVLGMTPADLEEKVNVNGGAVAIGHPIGASGGRIIMALLYELLRSGKKTGVAAICSGMGQGDALLLEAA